MATKVVMEALSPTMEEGRLVEWKKGEGEAVAVGDVLAEVETDKAVMELVARAGGTLLKQVVPAGTTVPVSQLVALDRRAGRAGRQQAKPAAAGAGAQATPGQRRPSPRPRPRRAPRHAPRRGTTARRRLRAARAAARARSAGQGLAAGAPDRGRARHRPGRDRRHRARRAASSLRDLEGAGGRRRARPRRRRRPVARATAGGPAYTDIPLTQIRKTIAKRLVQSIGPIPTFYLTTEVDMERAWDAREALQGARRRAQGFVQRHHHQGGRPRAPAAPRLQCLVAGRPHPLLERGPRQHGGGGRGGPDHAGDPPRRSQVAARDRRGVAGPGRRGRASGGSSPRSTPAAPSRSPTSACSTSTSSRRSSIRRRRGSSRSAGSLQKPVAHEGAVALRRRMRLTMSCDHRVIDGATGARFLQTLKAMLENPLAMV